MVSKRFLLRKLFEKDDVITLKEIAQKCLISKKCAKKRVASDLETGFICENEKTYCLTEGGKTYLLLAQEAKARLLSFYQRHFHLVNSSKIASSLDPAYIYLQHLIDENYPECSFLRIFSFVNGCWKKRSFLFSDPLFLEKTKNLVYDKIILLEKSCTATDYCSTNSRLNNFP